MRPCLATPPPPPVKLLTIFVVFCLCVLTFASWEIWRVEEASHKEISKLFQRERLGAKMIHLDEVLTLSAQMAVASKDLEWKTTYLGYEKDLEKVIQDAEPLQISGKCLRQISASKDKRVEMEKKVFALVHEGQLKSATGILYGSEYGEQKKFYHNGVVCFLESTRLYFESEFESHRHSDLRIFYYAVPAILLAFISFVFMIKQHSSAQELAQKDLMESEEKFRQLADTTAIIFWIASSDGKQGLYINSAYEKIWGRSRESFYKDFSSWMSAIHPADRERTSQAWSNIVVTGKYDVEYRVVQPNGEIRWVHAQGGPVRDDQGEIYRFAGTAEDITGKKRLTESLERSEETYRAVAQTANDAIISIKGPDGVIALWNKKAEQMFGYATDEAVSKNLHRLIVPERYRQNAHDGLRKFFATGEGSILGSILEVSALRRDGSEFPVELSIAGMRTSNGWEAIATVRDITQRMEDERKLKFAETQLMLSEKLAGIGQLSAGVCHEILNPLNIISIQTQLLLKREEGNPGLTERLTKIMGEIGRINKIVGSLMTFARKGFPELKPVQINAELDAALSLVERDCNLDNIKIVRNYQSPLPEIKIDTDEMRQVFLNLINNARYEMRGGGTLTVKNRLEKIGDRDHVRICFCDTGSGIKKEHLTKIFDPFFTTKPEGKGTGMGLPMAHSIVEKHGGTIVAESEEGKGAAFIIDLPVKRGD